MDMRKVPVPRAGHAVDHHASPTPGAHAPGSVVRIGERPVCAAGLCALLGAQARFAYCDGGGGRSGGGVRSKRSWPEPGSIDRSYSVQNVISFATVFATRV